MNSVIERVVSPELKKKTITITVKLEFLEGMLGTLPANKNIFTDYIASKAPTKEATEDEVESFNIVAEPAGTSSE